MITNGEKYACESCIRGHRVAQCQHTESGKRAVRYRSAIIVARYGPRDRFIQGVNADQPLGRQRSNCLVKSDASVRIQDAAIQRITGGSGTCCAQTDVGLNNEYSEDVNDTWIPVNGPPHETPQSPTWSGLWEPDLQPISDEQDQFNMQIFDPSLSADPNVDPWFDYLDHLPEQSYTDPIFDPALLDLTPLTLDGPENHQGTFEFGL
ncbi:hypothetical protein CDV31_011688 [Fusarium ambrosium]|uniref:Copper-fist domain-containing protein n=1 Tax=Fusarium ambrosium TaxID=131363 RepID=A0A428TF58_9HYPO|nr:hypothetical protein CDV31_011688 [Fusarium ambrosium]